MPIDPTLAPLPSQPASAAGRRPHPALTVLGVLGIAAAGVLFGRWLGSLGEVRSSGWELGGGAKLGLILGTLPVLFAVLATHELGHLIGGRLAGFRFVFLIVGPIKVYRDRRRVRLGLNRSFALAGGIAAAMPEDTRNLLRRTMMMILGGPLTSLLTGGAAFWLHSAFDLAALQPEQGVPALFGGIALFTYALGSTGIGLVTLVPGKTSGFLTDGARALQLARGGASAERDAALFTLTAMSRAGRRPREWDSRLVEQATAITDDSLFEAASRLLAASHALDRSELEAARSHLARAIELTPALPPTVRPALALEAAWFEGAVRGDAEAARRWLETAGEGVLVADHARPRAEAAVLAAEGRVEAATERAAAAKRLLADDLDVGMARALGSWLDELVAPRPSPPGRTFTH